MLMYQLFCASELRQSADQRGVGLQWGLFSQLALFLPGVES